MWTHTHLKSASSVVRPFPEACAHDVFFFSCIFDDSKCSCAGFRRLGWHEVATANNASDTDRTWSMGRALCGFVCAECAQHEQARSVLKLSRMKRCAISAESKGFRSSSCQVFPNDAHFSACFFLRSAPISSTIMFFSVLHCSETTNKSNA